MDGKRTNGGKWRNARAAFALDLESPCVLIPDASVCSLSLSSSDPVGEVVVMKHTSIMRVIPASMSVYPNIACTLREVCQTRGMG